MTEPTAPEHRSVSQYNTYQRCPYAYKLSRIDGVWQRPAAWLAQGSAEHEAAEAWEKSWRKMSLEETQDVFRESYAKHINEACEITPELNSWFSSGPYRGEQDIERRYGLGLNQISNYISYYENNPQQVIWVDPNTGLPGIELGFDIVLDGVLVRGFIDSIISHDGDIIVRDYKSGNKPGDEFQLATYAVGFFETHQVQATRLDYFMSKQGKPTDNYDINEWGKDRITGMFKELEENIKQNNFPPKPSKSVCNFCDVSDSCEYRWRVE